MKPRLTQKQLAERVGVGVKTIYNLEQGEYESPHTLRLVCSVLGVAEGDLGVAERGVETASGGTEAEFRDMLEHLGRYPIGVRTSLLTWGAWLSRMDPAEQERRIHRMTMVLYDDEFVEAARLADPP